MKKRVPFALLAAAISLNLLWPVKSTATEWEAKEVIPLKYDFVQPFSEGLAQVCTGDAETAKWGLIDPTGKEVIEPKYDYITNNFSDGFAQVKIDGKYGLINTAGRRLSPANMIWCSTSLRGLHW